MLIETFVRARNFSPRPLVAEAAAAAAVAEVEAAAANSTPFAAHKQSGPPMSRKSACWSLYAPLPASCAAVRCNLFTAAARLINGRQLGETLEAAAAAAAAS